MTSKKDKPFYFSFIITSSSGANLTKVLKNAAFLHIKQTAKINFEMSNVGIHQGAVTATGDVL